MSESLHDLSSDISVFVEERCEVGPEHQILVDKLFPVWQTWCTSRNIRYSWQSNQFTEKLRAAVPTITTSRPRKDNPRRLTTLVGIALRPKIKKATE
jgi:phage/plasmid-associated DNA primase